MTLADEDSNLTLVDGLILAIFFNLMKILKLKLILSEYRVLISKGLFTGSPKKIYFRSSIIIGPKSKKVFEEKNRNIT